MNKLWKFTIPENYRIFKNSPNIFGMFGKFRKFSKNNYEKIFFFELWDPLLFGCNFNLLTMSKKLYPISCALVPITSTIFTFLGFEGASTTATLN